MDTFSYPSRTNNSLAASRISCRRNFFRRALRSFTPCCRVFLTRLTLLTVLCNQSLVNSSFFSHAVQAFRIVLLLPHCDSLQFKVSPDKERPRTDEFARGIIFRREVARVNGIELLEQRQIRARDLHVHQIIHRHSRLSQDFFFAIEQHFDFVFYFFWNFARLRINADSSRQVECVARKNRVAEWRLHGAACEFDHFECRLRRRLRKRPAYRKNSCHRQNHHEETDATIHELPPFE